MKQLGKKGERILLQGNEAIAEGAVAAGIRFYAGYPITPSSEIAEAMARRLPQVGGVYLQLEDEIASMGAVIGASLAGMKAMDATSGPGFSLKQELLGFACFAEVPLVLVDVQRVGPSSGMATLPAQGDVMQARWGTHGDHSIIALAPNSVQECFTVMVRAVNLAEKFRSPVIVLTDGAVGHMREVIELPPYGEVPRVGRKGPTVPPDQYLPYKPGEDLVPEFAGFGTGYHWRVNSSMHDETGCSTTENHEVARRLLRRLQAKIDHHREEIIEYEQTFMEDAEFAVVSYGGTARAALAAVKRAREEGIKAGLFRLITIWPFPEEPLRELARQVGGFLVAEMNLGQVAAEVRRAVEGAAPVHSLGWVGGELIRPEQVLTRLREVARCRANSNLSERF